MVAEYDRLPAGEKGALLRREGLYSSHIIEWRRARDAGTLTGPTAPTTPAPKRGKSAEQTEIERLRRQNERLDQPVGNIVDAMKDSTALVTCANKGIGKEIARQLTTLRIKRRTTLDFVASRTESLRRV
jgi:hypothetical protein